MEYSTYLGGGLNESANAIAVDTSGNAYVTGFTSSTDFPLMGAAQTSLDGFGFMAKLNAAGNFAYSSYLGGEGEGIAVNNFGNVFVTGFTQSANFPTTAGSFQPTSATGFFTGFNASGCSLSLAYSTRWGANNPLTSQLAGVAVDNAGNAYLTGTAGPGQILTTPGAFQPTIPPASINAFVTKMGGLAFTGSPDFCLSASSAILNPGGSASVPVQVDSTNGFNSPVDLRVTSVNGLTVSLGPTTITPPGNGAAFATLTLSASAGLLPGSTYPLTIMGSSGALSHQTTVFVTISDFSLTASPFTVNVGALGSTTVNVNSLGGFASPVSLSVSNPPSGVRVFLSSASVTPVKGAPASVDLSVFATLSASPSTFPLIVTGTSGSLTHQAIIAVTVSSPGTGGGGTGGGGTGGGTQTCACSLTGAYVAPAAPVDPVPSATPVVQSNSILSPRGKYTATATYDTANPASGATLSVTRNRDQVVVFPMQNFAITLNFGFTPDDDRFVLHYLTGSMDNVQLYDLTVQPARLIVSTQSPASGTTSTALAFSPSGRYFMYEYLYENGGQKIAHLKLYQVQNVASQLLIYDSGDFFQVSVPGSGEDNFGVLGQGFSPDNPETTFVYSYVTGQSQLTWNLVNLVTPQTKALKAVNLADISDTWEFSPCGDVVGLIRQLQPNALGPSTVAEVDLISTATGLSLNPNGYQAATIQLSLNCTSAAQQVTDNSTGTPTVVTLVPNTGCSNTPVGANVSVAPVDLGGSGLAPVTITFSNVTVAGATTLSVNSSGPPPPANTQPGNPAKYFYLSTTATFESATVCISYADLTFGSSNIILLHNSNGTWDIPPQTLDTTHQTVCATVTSFSPFTIVEQGSSPTVSLISASSVAYGTPASVTVAVNSSSATVIGAVTLTVDGGAAVSTPLSNGSATFNLGMLSAGSHSLLANFAAQGSFAASTSNGTLVVTQAPLTIAATNISKVYGAVLPALAFTASGFVNGDTTASLSTQPTLITTATAGSGVGNYAISISSAVDTNYSITYVQGTLTVTPAPLTAAAANAQRAYGAPNPIFSGTITGIQNGDNIMATYNTAATPASPVGTYTVAPTLVDPNGKLGNYTVILNSGILTVTAASVNITANNATKVLNAANPPLGWTATGFANGETTSVLTTNPTCTTTAATNSPVGTYPITCSGASAANYVFVYVPGMLRIQYSTSIGHVIQPPINRDGTSAFNQGRTIPAKFNVYDANGVAIGTPGVVSSFFLTGIVSRTFTATVENVVDTNNPDTAFRWDGQEWIFNITTGNLTAGSTYVYTIALNDGSTIIFQYGLR